MRNIERTVRLLVVLLVTMAGLLTSLPAGAGKPGPSITAVDLAAVPPVPGDLPEPGYQFAQGGAIDLSGLKYAWSGDGVDDAEWGEIDDGWIGGHTQVLVLLTDRGDASSEPLATLTTFVLEFDDADTASGAASDLLAIAGYDAGDELDGVMVQVDRNGVIGAIASGHHVVIQIYAAAVVDGPGQNTEDWTAAAVASLTLATVDRLDVAVDEAGSGVSTLGTANLLVTGPDALWTLPWISYPTTEHYRIRNGDVLAYGGELSAQADDAVPDGVVDLFVSRQQFGDDGYDHQIDVTLARFDSEADAETFASDPAPIAFPPGYAFEATYGPAQEASGVVLQKASVNDEVLRASGWRTIRQEGDTVQVVQWLGSGSAVVDDEVVTWFTGLQSECLDAMPDPCVPVDQANVPVAIDAASADDQPSSTATAGDESVIASARFGWQVTLPAEDDWAIIDAQFLGMSEYYQLQSGRSLMTIETAVDQVGEPQQCVIDNLYMLQELEDRAVIDLGSDDPNERPAGIEQGHGWAIYTVEPLQEERVDQEYTIRIDCYTLVEGQASLVVTHTAPRDLWTEERDKGERFRDGIELPSTATTAINRPAGDRLAQWRTTAMGITRIWI